MLTELLYSFYTLQCYKGNLIFTYMPSREKRGVLPRQSIASNYAPPPPISVGTMGSVGAAAPTIIWQWVQTMYSAPTIFTSKTPFHSKQKKNHSFLSARITCIGISFNIDRDIEILFCFSLQFFSTIDLNQCYLEYSRW